MSRLYPTHPRGRTARQRRPGIWRMIPAERTKRRNRLDSVGVHMGNRKIILIFAMAILSLSAGLVVGWVWTPLQKVQATAPGARPGPRPWFDQLQLASDQQKQMDK